MSSDKLDDVRLEVEAVKNVMIDNLEKVIKREENLNNISDKSEHLLEQSVKFNNGSKTLRKAMWWKNKKLTLMIGVVCFLIILLVIILVAMLGK